MTKYSRLVAASVMALAAASTASAQSLGEVARKEEARRKAVAKPGKVYTNEDVRAAEAGYPTPTPVAPGAEGPQATPPSLSGAQAKPDDKAAAEKDPRQDEAYWRGRMQQARDGLERAKTFEEALQSRINALSTDFAARDDPAQRNTIANDRQKALGELDRVKKEIADFQKQIQDIEDEARKAGVPPGWLR